MKPLRLLLGVTLALAGTVALSGPLLAQGIQAVYSRDGTDVWAVGDAGTVYRSFNGGAAWTSATLGNKVLRGVAARGFTVCVVGDSGKIWRSVNSGGAWAISMAAGVPNLRAIEMTDASNGWIVGDGGTILHTTDGGANWSAQTSGTALRLNAVRFTDALHGWAVGNAGTALSTNDGGANWSPIAFGFPVPNDLYAVDVSGSAIWAVGANATALRSTNGGGSWTQLNLKADARPDVKAVWLQSSDSVYIAGGGGFIRRSYDGGATWTFLQHQMLAQISDLFFVNGANGWASSNKNLAVMRTNDRGATWSLPTGTTFSRAWASKLATGASIRGSSMAINPVYKNTLYACLGGTVYRSFDEGETWASISTIPGTGVSSKANSFIVSPKDSNLWVAAFVNNSGTRQIMRTENYGSTWNSVFTGTGTDGFGEYGIPLEVDTDRPDTMYFGTGTQGSSSPTAALMRSIDGGKTWSNWSTTLFRSPCDIICVPGSDSTVILVGDGVTGSGIGDLWRSAGGSTVFQKIQNANGSEIPGMSCARLRNNYAVGTTWGSSGPRSTSTNGLSWPVIANLSGVNSTWGTDIARDDPNVVMVGVYSGSQSYLSLDGGVNFLTNSLSGSNYSFLLRDRGLILAEQGGGVYKLGSTYSFSPSNTQAATLTAPNGGESWPAGQVRNVTWSATNVAIARLEYRLSSGDSWHSIAEVEGYAGTYAWTVPEAPTTTAEVRVSDAWDGSPLDGSNAVFTILAPAIAEQPLAIAFGSHPVGSATLDSLRVTNTGTASLVISSISTGTSAFTPGRSSLTLAPGASDSVGVTFHPSVSISYGDTLTLVTNVGSAPLVKVPLSGAGEDTLHLALMSPNGGQSWQYANSYSIEWESAVVQNVIIEYQDAPANPWNTIATSVPASSGSYSWIIPDDATAQAKVRIRQLEPPARQDQSDAMFSIVVPGFDAAPSPLTLDSVEEGTVKTDTLHFENKGTAPLVITSATIDGAEFWLGRSSLTVPAGGGETLGVSYEPTSAGDDTATVTLVTNDPATPHTVTVYGHGQHLVGVGHGTPTAFALYQSAPNPWSDRTRIRYALPRRTAVSLEVFNIQGQRVASLVNEVKEAGDYSVPFGSGAGGAGLPAGMYFYRLRAGEFTATRRMLVLR